MTSQRHRMARAVRDYSFRKMRTPRVCPRSIRVVDSLNPRHAETFMLDTSDRTRPRWLSILLWAVILVGLMQMMGAAFEVLNMLMPSMLPDIQDNEIMQLHHEQPVVEAWTTIGNLAGLVLGVGFVVGGRRLLRGDAHGLRLTRVCAALTFVYVTIGAVVSAVFLVPLFVPLLDDVDPDRRLTALVFLITMAGSAGMFMVFSALVFFVLGRPATRRLLQGPE